jgi:hypothetical protein
MIYDKFTSVIEGSTDYVADITMDSVEESAYEPTMEGTLMHLLEAEENWNQIQEAIAFSELKGFMESGDPEYVLEAEQSEGMFTTVINWFKSMLAKIAAILKKFVNYMASKVASDKQFIKKFESIKGDLVIPSGFKFKGFNFSFNYDLATGNSKMTSIIDSTFNRAPGNNSASEIKSVTDQIKSGKKSFSAKLRAAALGKSGNMEEKEFRTELKKMFRSNSATPTQISVSKSDIDKYFNCVSSHKDAVKMAKDNLKKFKDITNSSIDMVKTTKEHIKDTKDKKDRSAYMTYCNMKISAYKEKYTILSRVNGALIDALNQQNRQAKSVLYAINGRQKTKFDESTIVSGGTFFDNIVMD